MLRKKVLFIFSLCILLVVSTLNTFAIEISAESAVVINADTGEVIYEKNAFQKKSMASTTKIMTSILAVESGMLNETVTIGVEPPIVEGTAIGLKKGYKILLKDLVYSMLLESGNDAAVATACFLADSEKAFSEVMNEKAKQLGMKRTNFVTASGLDNELHYTCAYDMALLGAYAVKNPVFREICSTKSYSFSYIKPNEKVFLNNHNRLLRSFGSVIGIKTGFTKKSGRCLVSAIDVGNSTFVVVTLSAPDDWNDHAKLFNYISDVCRDIEVNLNIPVSISVQGGMKQSLSIMYDKCLIKIKNNEENFKAKVYLPCFIYAPIKEGDIIGKYQIYFKNKLIDEKFIFASENINAVNETYKPKKNIFVLLKEKLLK